MFRLGCSRGNTGPYPTLLRHLAAGVRTPAGAFLFTISLSAVLAAQGAGRVTGLVTDSLSDRPMSDVQVVVVGTRIGAVTDAEGRYTIVGAPAGSRGSRLAGSGIA